MEKINVEKFKELAQKYDLKLLLLFGSQVSGKTHPMSDFDFGFVSKKELSYGTMGGLSVDLSRLVEKEADVVDLKNAGPLLKYEITKNNKILYDAKNEYEYFFVIAMREYFEAKRLFEMRDRMVANKINEFKKVYAK
ncbi:MAG: nucleotidyltransferase domain-containing protein [Candidatus Moraniibacteriota bacterium]|jgi:predicted nucleotidyltransferase